jgi:phosphoglycolate phosphatase
VIEEGVRNPMFRGKRVRGVVLDLDGTLVNTTVDFGLMKQRVATELVSLGIPSSLLDGGRTTAENLDRSVGYLSSHGREGEIGMVRLRLGEVMNRTELERVSGTTAVSGAVECLDRLRARGLRTGLLTRGSRAYALAALRYSGLDMNFDAVVCRDDFPEEEAKPNGKAMTRIVSMMGLRAEECILVGDHAMDLHCARSVSSGFVGVLSGSFGSEDWSRSGCETVIESVALLPQLLFDQKS